MGSAAEQSKSDGNAAFKLQDYPLALSHYSTAIQLDPSISTYPLNRSLVHLKLSNWKEAEKDAKRALELDGGANVKALFRRGLARKGMGKLGDAKKDFEEALGQGAGADVQAELAKVKLELALDAKGKSTEKSKVSASIPSPSTAQPVPSTAPLSKSDRLRAAIASPASAPPSKPSSPSSSSSISRPQNSTATASKPSSTAAIQNDDSGGFMKAVSTRKLKPTSTSSPPAPVLPTSSDSILPTPATDSSDSIAQPPTPSTSSPQPDPLPSPSPSSNSPPAPSSFASKKLSRSTRQPSYLPPTASTSSQSLPLRSARPSHPSSQTLTSLESSLLLLPPSSPSRKDLLRSLDPSKLVEFMGDSLTPDLLSLILAELDSEEEGQEEEGWKFELLGGLSECRRFGTARMMLGEEEVGVVRRVMDGMEGRVKGARGKWEV